MWVFGLSTTLLLLGLWGRAVTIDQVTVEESAQAVVDADVAQDRIYDWIEAAIVQSSDAGSADASVLVESWRNRPEFNAAIDNIIGDFVGALFAEPGSTAVIDIGDAIAPALPVILDDLAEQSVPVEESVLVEALDDASVLELDTGGAATVSTIVEEARGILTRVVLVAFLMMALSAIAALILADENYAMLRTLAVRVTLSAISFAILFRLSAWALDPSGGRSPIAAGGSIVLGSNGYVFLVIAGVAAAIGAVGAWVAWQRRRPAFVASPMPVEPTVAEDDTKELAPV
jgi:hypothetical protein